MLKGFFIILAMFCLSFISLNASEYVVLESNLPGVRSGEFFKRSRVNLKKSQKLKLINRDGNILEFIGPLKKQLSAKPKTKKISLSSIKSLFRKESLDSGDLGAIRSAGIPQTQEENSKSIWSIDINQKGFHCVLDKQPITLWRGNNQKKTQ